MISYETTMDYLDLNVWKPWIAGVLTGAISIWCIQRYVRARASGNGKHFDLRHKVVCVTGATGGLGIALSHALLSRGARTVLTGRNVAAIRELTDNLKIAQLGEPKVYEAVGVQLDLLDLDSIPQKSREILNVFGRVDVLIHNAGVSSRGSVKDTSVAVDMQLMKTNYLAPVALTKEILPSMLEHGGGCIVAVSSVQGRLAIPYRSPYAASKHALQAFFDCFRAEIQDENIRVLVVSPGYIRTNLSMNALTGTGTPHAKMDASTLAGMSPESVAERIIRAIETGETEVLMVADRTFRVVSLSSRVLQSENTLCDCGNVTLDVKLSRPNKTYRKGDSVSGTISVHSTTDSKHDGIAIALEGSIAMHMDNKNILLETFYSSLKPTQIAFSSLELAKPGRLMSGTSEIPFNVILQPLSGKSLFETYHGVYITVQYMIKCEMKRSVLNRDLMKSIEFVVEVPQTYDSSENKSLPFNITPESLQNVAEGTRLPRFCIKGRLDNSHFKIFEPMLGELIVERCEIGIKSIELQLVRVETCGSAEGFAKESTEIQNIQIGDGDVCRNLAIPIYMVFPRLFTCPTTISPNFKIEFELNLIVIFDDDHLVMETFEINLVRPL